MTVTASVLGNLMIAAALFIGSLAVAETDTNPQDLKLQLDRNAPVWLADYDVPSVAVAYIADGELAWTAAYGTRGAGVPADSDTLYNIASMTKPVTAEVALRLASKHKLALDETMSAHWIDPDIRHNAWHELLTPEISLTHQTGFSNWRYQTDDMLQFQWQPGTKTGYSGEGYRYLARFLEEKLAARFEELASQEVFSPLDMRNTGWTPSADDATRIALPHDEDGGTLEPAISDPWSAADNLYTTIHDYATFMLAVMHGKGVDPAIASDRFRVRDNAIEWMGCPLPAAQCPLEVGFGLGWEVFVYESETIVQHAGSDRGERTLGFFVPGTGKGVIIFTNGANGAKVIRDIVSLLHDNSGFQAFLNMQAGR